MSDLTFDDSVGPAERLGPLYLRNPNMSLDQRFPCIDDMERAALRRIPRFASEYLRGGIGREAGLHRNREALDRVLLEPVYLPEQAANQPDLGTELLGECYDLPFGISPLGLSGLIWPGAAEILAAAARSANIPMGLSHFATTHMTDFRRIAGANGWFQFYPTSNPGIRQAMLQEIGDAGFTTLIVTVDIPTATRRDRELRVGLSVPPRFNARTVVDILMHPRWAIETALLGAPRFQNLRAYMPEGLSTTEEAQWLTEIIEGHVTIDILKDIRALWPGKMIVKGILTASDAGTALEAGADALWVSNHGARQLDAASAPIDCLASVRVAAGDDVPLLVDSGYRTGLDIARGLASGADFVFLGRAFMFAVAAIGADGAGHAVSVLREELRCAMAQVGCRSIGDLPGFLAVGSQGNR